MSKTLARIIAAGAIGTLAAHAGAAVISDTEAFNFSSISFYDYKYGYSSTSPVTRERTEYVTLDGFDSTLGTLTGVNISFNSSYSLTSAISATDDNNNWGTDYTNGTARASTTMTVDLIDPDGPEENRYRSVWSSCSDSARSDPSCSSSRSTSGYFNGVLNLAGIDLDLFLDSDITLQIDQLLSTIVTSCDSDSDCYGWNRNNAWSGNATVSYIYDEKVAVPEPGVLALLGLGLAGLGVSRRKSKA